MAHVLVVEDEAPIRQLLSRALLAEGHDVAEAGDAEAALAIMLEHPADVVFCDIQMPGRDGLWLTRQIRERFPRTAVILATGNAHVAPSDSMQFGVVAYLVKPFRRETMLVALDQALGWQRSLPADKAIAPPQADLLDWLDAIDERLPQPEE
jgi:CheY-like chemotaxis protein